jgi:hypothetical protein
MATEWISRCDRCGKEDRGGDERAKALFNTPGQPADAYFRFNNDDRTLRSVLKLDLCAECGKWLEGGLRHFIPRKFWDASRSKRMAMAVTREWFEKHEVPEMERWLLEQVPDAERSITGRQVLALIRNTSRFLYTTDTVYNDDHLSPP